MEEYLIITISLEVRGFSIREEEISTLLGKKSTEFYDDKTRMPKFAKTTEDIWTHNLWVYSIETSEKCFQSDLRLFLNDLNINNLVYSQSPISDVRIHIMVDSVYAQIHLPFSQAVIDELNRLGLMMDVNVVSLGYIKKNSHRLSLKKLFAKREQ